MHHSRNASDISDLSETISEPESVISFNEDVHLVMQNAVISTATYVEQARQIIEQLATNQNRWITTPPSVHDVDASRILDAMLRNAHGTGGESSERYTACAICACQKIHEQVNLTRTWFMYLLWPFTAGAHQPSDLVSGRFTSTVDDTYGSLAGTKRSRKFRTDVNRRDGYKCAVSGIWDGAHIPAGVEQGWITLQATHILKRAVGVFTMDRAHSAAATWNIIQHYSGMSEETIQNMERLVDDPSNGMMLERNIYDHFDKLKVYLEQTERENEYVVKEVGGRPWMHPRELLGKTITFQNHDAPTEDLPLPNPHLIALHAGISQILYMSGASEVFAQILDKYDGAAGGNAGSLKCNGDPVHQLSSMMSVLSICASLIA
ncbi:uncharacterized protein F5891DRAFT_1061703 [Suillus fuscotomentosus]|uniref:HNH nuclease domain-containing protein n=1 Tax=Suillus fuscotomentosus TaxID=1912939 RepID=A0AAD4HFK7_9AGAM|nr:uncharacterized protein F5891DRAFT_1061703 [Suillus fuscotomentosus]KAG1894687.1 hypothetical protein F5891DRAFT_1061703 [Suillus fuscotomentosus]